MTGEGIPRGRLPRNPDQRKANPSTSDVVEQAIRDYSAKFNLDDAMGLFYCGYVCRKLKAAITAGVRLRDCDRELVALRVVVFKLRQ